ncbi:hypothetical protein C8Q80DRAFT_1111831 [Daedaleopsis nitida]|nr:hypothetical protein C8Q80DRAFT_1111831 [Daedaleopsis nitida]
MRNQCGAPVWEHTLTPRKSWALRFFDQVDRVLANYQVADNAEKKKTLTMYAEGEYVRMIESHPSSSDVTKTYAALKTALLEFFPGLEDSKKWTVPEYNAIVGEYLRTGVDSLPTYLAFYWRLYPIALYLARNKTTADLTEREVTSTMLMALNPDFAASVKARLSFSVTKDVNDLYRMEDVHKAISHTVIVAETSHKLRSIATWVNNSDIVECILDGGSQIVSCSVEKAHSLGIHWDLTACITMMSANGDEQSTLGLARDVPVDIVGGVTVYLQMHIVQNTLYDILLGRPFEVLLAAEIRNEFDGRQTLEITCPNTGKRVAMPTYAKGTAPPGLQEPPMGFRQARM